MSEPDRPTNPRDAVTTPAGITTICPQCGAILDTLTTSCGRCGAVITSGGAGGEREERLRLRLQGQIGAAYQLGPMIGRGGMGIVFRAREVALDREVALKVLAFDPVLNPDAFTRFEREARLAARLDHPNIVPIFAVGQGDGAAFYTMRFVRGGSLETMITEHGALALDTTTKLLHEIAAALDYAHAQGIVHRDIKPANILLSETGHAMVADFGIARAFTGDAVTSTSGSHTGVVGSPAYMAPEQWRGDKPDGRADQYALGVLAFEMLSGLRPFREVSMQELLRMHLSEAPPELATLRKDLPPYVGDAIRRAMAKEPSDRFPSSTAFVTALAGQGGGAAGAARGVRTQPRAAVPAPDRARPAAAPPAGGRRWIGGMIGAVLVVVAAAAGWNAWTARRAPVAAPPVDTLAARLARELEETRKIALDAQARAERAERAEAQQRAQERTTSATPAAKAVGHVAVGVRGGTPRLLIDGQESASSTPAIIEVPVGRHIVRVEQVGRAYQPAQWVIDVRAGDTAKLMFTDVRFAGREGAPPTGMTPSAPGQPGMSGQRFPRPGFADSLASALRDAQAAGAAARAAGPLGDGAQNPFYLPARIWQSMSPNEQEMLRQRWSRMTPEQQRRAIKDIQSRDTVRFIRRAPPTPRPPAP